MDINHINAATMRNLAELQTNTFLKGMNTDTSDALLSSELYRYAENVRIVTDTDNNSGELRIVDGLIKKEIKKADNKSYDKIILASNSIRNIAVFVAIDTYQAQDDGTITTYSWCIYKYDFDKNEFSTIFNSGPIDIDGQDSIIPLNWDRKTKTIDTILCYESENNIKLYIADGIHLLMSIDINNENGNNFDDVFLYQNKLLPSLNITVGLNAGVVDGPVVQYAYRLYKENGTATSISPLSNVLQLSYSNNKGFGIKEQSNKSVQINAPLLLSNTLNKMLIYRISYVQLGQPPVISKVYDGGIVRLFTDFGGSSQISISTSDFISMLDVNIIPKVIEAKNNRLFLANVFYKQDDIDKLFEDFDTRAYSLGMNYLEGDISHILLQDTGLVVVLEERLVLNDYKQINIDLLKSIPQDSLVNSAFVNGYTLYDPEKWENIYGSDGQVYNGVGLYFAWKYDMCTAPDFITSGKTRIYRSGEVYRFGVRLFDKKGRASSVKWIADIQIPTHNITEESSFKEDVCEGITFYPLNTNKDIWDNISAYEIVLCKRNETDRITLFTGIIGHVQQCEHVSLQAKWNDNNITEVVNETGSRDTQRLFSKVYEYLTPIGYLSLCDIVSVSNAIDTSRSLCYLENPPVYEDEYAERVRKVHWAFTQRAENPALPTGAWIHGTFFYAHPKNNILQFVCPEYVYLSDDVKNIINTNKTNLSVVLDNTYIPDSKKYTIQDSLASNEFNFYRAGVSYEGVYTAKNNDYSYLINPTQFVSSSVVNKTIAATNDRYIPKHIIGVIKSSYSDYDQNTNNTFYDYYDTTDADRYNNDDLKYCFNYITTCLNYINPQEEIYGDVIAPYEDFNIYCDGRVRITHGVYSDGPHLNNYINTRLEYNSDRYVGAKFSTTRNSKYLRYHSQSVVTPQILYTKIPLKSDFDNNFKIKEVLFIDAPSDKDFVKDGMFSFYDNALPIETNTFINWTNPFLKPVIDIKEYGNDIWPEDRLMASFKEIQEPLYDGFLRSSAYLAAKFHTSSGGKCIVFSLLGSEIKEEEIFNYNLQGREFHKGCSMPPITTARIIQNVTPYGGYSTNSLNSSYYISVGAFSLNKQEEVSVEFGDCFLEEFNYCSSHLWHDPEFFISAQPTILYKLYIESDIDLRNQSSNNLLGVTTNDYRTQEKATSFLNLEYIQPEDLYKYNTVYGVIPDVVSWTSNATSLGETGLHDTRVHFSQPKNANEVIDSWMQFKVADFIDVDSKYGPITSMKTFKNYLMFWQESSTGILSVNDRSVVLDITSNNIVLGTGGILDRYDYISTIYGLKPYQHNETVSDSTLYWWDGYNKEIMAYSGGQTATCLSTIKNIKNYLNSADESDTPMLFYNNKYKEVVCSVAKNNNTDQSIIYNEHLSAFTSVYTYNPQFYIDVKSGLYSFRRIVDEGTPFYIYKENGETQDSASYYSDAAYPLISYVVNKNSTISKTFDTQLFGGRFYGGEDLSALNFEYSTPLKLNSQTTGRDVVTNIEYDFRLSIPRNGHRDPYKDYGDRMRGKTMRCTLSSTSSDKDFSLLYIITKFRLSC